MSQTLDRIRPYLRKHFQLNKTEFVPGKTRIPLTVPTYGSEYAVMVNSGSSANLLALSVLTNPILPDHIERGSEIITPAVTWATTVYPIANVGCIPVLVD